MMGRKALRTGEFTGRHMLVIIIAFFGVVVAVNVTMASLASRSWSGLVVKNSYVASQQFNGVVEEARRQAALGWTSRMTYAEGKFGYRLLDGSGKPVTLRGVSVDFRRQVTEGEDKAVRLSPAVHGFSGPVQLGDGVWLVQIVADAGEPYRELHRITVRGGEMR
jgi:nitrogen fixation protein FixH